MKTVDAYIEALPEERKEICEILREIILENVPGIIEKLSFKIPFYHYYGMFMYLNNTKEGIDVAFCRGRDLLETFPQLTSKSRAIVATVCIKHKKEINSFAVREMIVTAAAWNEEAKRLKIPMVKKAAAKKQRI
ncbi:MAG TPA: DUF1801 domain-containing protein [Chitinophagaceae bacterium]